jgi:hypothetical protein
VIAHDAAKGERVLSEEQAKAILSLIATTSPDPGESFDVRAASMTLSTMRSSELWPNAVRDELDGIGTDIARLVSKAELSRFGLGPLPDDAEFDAAVERVRSLARFVTNADTGAGDAPIDRSAAG